METAKAGTRLRSSHGQRLTVAATAARVFPGRAGEANAARTWVRSLTAAAGAAADGAAELITGELFANAVQHTRSGSSGGKITVVVAPAGDEVAVHMHDQGTDAGLVPAPAPPGDGHGLRDSGWGLQIVDAVCGAKWGVFPVICCPCAAADDPAVSAGGCCVWFGLSGATGNEEGTQVLGGEGS